MTHFCRYSSDGNFSSEETCCPTAFELNTFVAADLNNNGSPDLVSATQFEESIIILFNLGHDDEQLDIILTHVHNTVISIY